MLISTIRGREVAREKYDDWDGGQKDCIIVDIQWEETWQRLGIKQRKQLKGMVLIQVYGAVDSILNHGPQQFDCFYGGALQKGGLLYIYIYMYVSF